MKNKPFLVYLFLLCGAQHTHAMKSLQEIVGSYDFFSAQKTIVDPHGECMITKDMLIQVLRNTTQEEITIEVWDSADMVFNRFLFEDSSFQFFRTLPVFLHNQMTLLIQFAIERAALNPSDTTTCLYEAKTQTVHCDY